jgi:phosphohistidine phosphatase
MKLYIVRHGEARSPGPGAEQALTESGLQQAKRRAQSLANESIQVLVHSPKLRAIQTAEIIHQAAVGDCILCDQRLLPEAEVTEVVQMLEQYAEANVVLISHLPLVAHLADWLCEGRTATSQFAHFVPAGLVALEMDVVGQGCAKLLEVDFDQG